MINLKDLSAQTVERAVKDFYAGQDKTRYQNGRIPKGLDNLPLRLRIMTAGISCSDEERRKARLLIRELEY